MLRSARLSRLSKHPWYFARGLCALVLSNRATWGQRNHCKHISPCKISRADTGPKFSCCFPTSSRRNVSFLPQLVTKEQRVQSSAQATTTRRLFYTLLHRSWAAQLWEDLLGRADIGADSPRRSLSGPVNITAPPPSSVLLQKHRKLKLLSVSFILSLLLKVDFLWSWWLDGATAATRYL